jgi:hypothetical protein
MRTGAKASIGAAATAWRGDFATPCDGDENSFTRLVPGHVGGTAAPLDFAVLMIQRRDQ